LRGSGLPSLLHLKTEDQFPISAFRLRFTFPSILETDAYWLAVTAFKGSGSSPFSATFQRWTKKKKKNLKVTRQCLKRLRFTFPSILETDAYWLTVTAFMGSGSSPFSATLGQH
jgi:hypothetical protein